MKRFGNWAVALSVACILGIVGAMTAPPAFSRETGSVYLLRGGFNVFSEGLDELAVKLRAQGIEANVAYYGGWRALVDEIARRHNQSKDALPVVLMGHSFGADAVLQMAASLSEKNVPVELIVTFDPLRDIKVAGNVRHVINFFVGGGGLPATPAAAFRGTIENVDVRDLDRAIVHLNIEEDEGLQKRAISATLRAFN